MITAVGASVQLDADTAGRKCKHLRSRQDEDRCTQASAYFTSWQGQKQWESLRRRCQSEMRFPTEGILALWKIVDSRTGAWIHRLTGRFLGLSRIKECSIIKPTVSWEDLAIYWKNSQGPKLESIKLCHILSQVYNECFWILIWSMESMSG